MKVRELDDTSKKPIESARGICQKDSSLKLATVREYVLAKRAGFRSYVEYLSYRSVRRRHSKKIEAERKCFINSIYRDDESGAELSEREEWIRRQIDSLPWKQRWVVYLKYYRGLDNGESADMLSMTPAGISLIEKRALETLKLRMTKSKGNIGDYL